MHKTAKKICVNILMENQDYHFVLLQDISMNYLFILALQKVFEGIDTWAKKILCMYLTFFILTSIISKKKLIHIIFKVICNSSGEVYKNAFWMERETYANVNGIRVKLSTFLLLYILCHSQFIPITKTCFITLKRNAFFMFATYGKMSE